MKISNLTQAEKVLLAYVPAVKAFTGKNITLARVAPLMRALGSPQDKLKVIHIAGTSGKTSTSYYVAALLLATGSSVGLTVSPHIDKVTERIQLNGRPINEDLFCRYLGECIDIVATLDVQPSYFELLMALSYWIFYKEGVDYAVIETGMGGLEDGSNVATRADKVCILTDIGLDHMHILGDTIAKIAAQKAGIIHLKNTVFMYAQDHDVMTAVRKQIERTDADLHIARQQSEVLQIVQDLPYFQQRNFSLASQAVRYVCMRDSLTLPGAAALQNASHTYIPARMDTIRVGDKVLIMDGAHNGQKMATFVASFSKQHSGKKAAVLLSLKEGKEYAEVLDELVPITDTLIVTTFATTQDLPSKAMDPHKLANEARARGITTEVVTDNKKAYDLLLSQANEVLVITGSFYMIGQIRKNQGIGHIY